MTASPGDTVTCNFEVENTGALPAVITELVEISPDPGGAPVNIACTAGGITYDEGDTLPNGVDCLGTFTPRSRTTRRSAARSSATVSRSSSATTSSLRR